MGRLSALTRAALQPPTRVVSVDVFDTLLLRQTRPEYARFADIGRLQWAVLRAHGLAASLRPDDLLPLRVMAARAAYRHTPPVDGVRDATHGEILNLVRRAAGLPAVALPLLRAAELEYEATVLRPNRALRRLLQRAAAAGRRVVCISDMYLRGDDIRALVQRRAPDLPLDAVYSSADFGVTKRSGLLFQRVLAHEGIAAHEMVHCGDSQAGDVQAARSLGIRAFYLPRGLSWRAVRHWRDRRFRRRWGFS